MDSSIGKREKGAKMQFCLFLARFSRLSGVSSELTVFQTLAIKKRPEKNRINIRKGHFDR